MYERMACVYQRLSSQCMKCQVCGIVYTQYGYILIKIKTWFITIHTVVHSTHIHPFTLVATAAATATTATWHKWLCIRFHFRKNGIFPEKHLLLSFSWRPYNCRALNDRVKTRYNKKTKKNAMKRTSNSKCWIKIWCIERFVWFHFRFTNDGLILRLLKFGKHLKHVHG